MVWAPVKILNIINSLKELNNIDPIKIESMNKNISYLEETMDSISKRELKICLQLINKNISIISKDINNNDEIEKLKKRIANLFTAFKESAGTKFVEEPNVITSAPTAKPDPVLNLVFLCNIDSHDENGAITDRINPLFAEQVPFVTTKALISGANLEMYKKFKMQEAHKVILENYPQWNIYIKGEFCVFIPKNYPFNIEELDFALSPDNQIKNIGDLFEGATGQAKIENFTQLFKPNGKVNKRVILNGHGNVGFIGGLNLEHYRTLIKSLHDSGCQILEVQSCHAGSMNVVEHYFGTEKTRITPSFPIIIRSIGSFATHGTDYSLSYKSNFASLDKLLNKKGALTVPQFKKMAKEKKHPKPEDFVNFMQIKFPYPQSIPGGFKPLGEDERVQTITYVDLRGAEVNKEKTIDIVEKKYIELMPLKVDVPLRIVRKTLTPLTQMRFDGKSSVVDVYDTPVFLSMIPGNAHHLISKVKGEGFNLLDLFSCHALAYEKCEAHKSLFIGDLELDGKTYSNVVMEFSEKVANMYFSIGDPAVFHHYQCIGDSKSIKDIIVTEFEFCALIHRAAQRTAPDAEALRTSNGGQENDTLFVKDLMHQVFWEGPASKGRLLPTDYSLYEKYKQKPTPETAKNLFKVINISSHQLLLQEAIINEDDYLARLLLTKGGVHVNRPNAVGCHLIHTAIRKQNLSIVKLLINKRANLNKTLVPNDLTPLMLAVYTNDLKMVELLLEHSNSIDFDLKDSFGWTALGGSSIMDNLEMFSLIYDSIKAKLIVKNKLDGEALENALDQCLNKVSLYGYTMLSYATKNGNVKLIEKLLELGADPYAGRPSSLSIAIFERNKEMVEFWLEKGIDVTKADSQGNSALDQACDGGTLEILELVLKKTDISKLADHPRYFQKVFSSKNFAKGWILHEAGITFPSNPTMELDSTSLELFNFCMQDPSLKSTKQFAAIFHKNLNFYDDLQINNLLSIAYKQHRVDIIQVLVENGANVLEEDFIGRSFLNKLIEVDDVETAKLCLENSRKLNFLSQQDYLALTQDKPKMFELLVQNGANPSVCHFGKSKSVLQTVMETGDEALFDICLKHKALNFDNKIWELDFNDRKGMLKKIVEYGADLTTPETDMPIKRLLKTLKDVELLDFILSSLPVETKHKVLNDKVWMDQALQENNLLFLKILIKHGADPFNNLGDEDSYFAFKVLKPENFEFFKTLLIESPAEKVQYFLKNNDNYFIKSIKYDYLQLSQLLLEHGANPQAKSEEKTVLKLILDKNNPEWLPFLETIIKQIPNEIAKASLNGAGLGEDYLIQAINRNDFQLFKFLINHGADPLYKCKFQRMAFVCLLRESKPDWLRLCLETICPAKNGSGVPLKRILKVMKWESIASDNLQLFKEYGVDLLREKDVEQVEDILSHAGTLTLENVAFALNSLEPKIAQELLNNYDHGISYLEGCYDNLGLFQLFLSHGADPLEKRQDETVFSRLFYSGNTKIIECCLKHICPEKNGERIPEKEILFKIQCGTPSIQILKLLWEYGFGLNNPEARAVLKNAIDAASKE